MFGEEKDGGPITELGIVGTCAGAAGCGARPCAARVRGTAMAAGSGAGVGVTAGVDALTRGVSITTTVPVTSVKASNIDMARRAGRTTRRRRRRLGRLPFGRGHDA